MRDQRTATGSPGANGHGPTGACGPRRASPGTPSWQPDPHRGAALVRSDRRRPPAAGSHARSRELPRSRRWPGHRPLRGAHGRRGDRPDRPRRAARSGGCRVPDRPQVAWGDGHRVRGGHPPRCRGQCRGGRARHLQGPTADRPAPPRPARGRLHRRARLRGPQRLHRHQGEVRHRGGTSARGVERGRGGRLARRGPHRGGARPGLLPVRRGERDARGHRGGPAAAADREALRGRPPCDHDPTEPDHRQQRGDPDPRRRDPGRRSGGVPCGRDRCVAGNDAVHGHRRRRESRRLRARARHAAAGPARGHRGCDRHQGRLQRRVERRDHPGHARHAAVLRRDA